MTSPTRTLVFSYNGWDSNDTGVMLTGLHDLDEDADSFRCVFTVVLSHASDEDVLLTYVNAMKAALDVHDKRFTITLDGTAWYDFNGNLSSLGGATAAQFVRCEYDLAGTHRSGLSRAYRVTVTVSKVAAQTGKIAKRSQRIQLSTTPRGWRVLRYSATFTPAANGTTALAMYSDGTDGFAVRVAAVQAAIDGDAVWERTSDIDQSYDEDARELVASASYRELIFAQSDAGTDDATLVGAQYRTRVQRDPATGTPDQEARSLARVTCTFSSGVLYSGSASDLDGAINSLALPRIKSTVVNRLSLSGTPILMGHTLEADHVNNSISGQAFFLVEEGTVIAATVTIARQRREGLAFVPVFDGDRDSFDIHQGHNLRLRRVAVVVAELGDFDESSPAAESLAAGAIADQEAEGFHFVGLDGEARTDTAYFESPQDGQSSIPITFDQRVLLFRYAKVRESVLGSAGPFDPAGASGTETLERGS